MTSHRYRRMKGKGRQQRIHRRGPEQGKLEEHRFDVGQDMSTILVQENRGSAVKKERTKKKKKKKRRKEKKKKEKKKGYRRFIKFWA